MDISKIFKDWQLPNILGICVTETVLNVDKFKFSNNLQDSNKLPISLTLFVSKLIISRVVNPSHPLNILFIFCTKLVLKDDTFKFSNFLQFANILFIISTLWVLKLHTFNDINLLHSENMSDISTTFLVLKCDKSKFVISEHL